MKTGKILLGGVAGAVTFFFLGWLVYGILLMGYTTGNFNQCAARPMDDMMWWAMILSNFACGFLLSILFNWTRSEGILDGIKLGVFIGLFFAISMDFSTYSMSTMFSGVSAVLIDILAYTTMSAVAGIVVAVVMGKRKME